MPDHGGDGLFYGFPSNVDCHGGATDFDIRQTARHKRRRNSPVVSKLHLDIKILVS